MPGNKLNILHVVRRYGPVGGMERYVWELTRELAALGHQVEVVCERCHVEKPPGIVVHELGEIAPRPRWLAQLRFSGRVTAWLKENPHSGWLIHSHERLKVHHVTTFHGPPFATIFERPFWRRISLRVWMRLYLERRELRVAQRIVPNSEIITRQLAHYYPEYSPKVTQPVVPGVLPGVVRMQRSVPQTGGIIGFVGREWQRKGLPLAVEIAARLRLERPQLELWVIGPDEREVSHLFTSWQGGYRLLGWRSDTSHFEKFDVLLHPAIIEPYGMVISEAMAARVAVVVSDACGAVAQLNSQAGEVVPLNVPIQKWMDAVTRQLDRTQPLPFFVRGWDEVTQESMAIYNTVLKETA